MSERAAAATTLDPALRARIDAVIEDGSEVWERFDREVRDRRFHPFVPGDYESVLRALLVLRAPGLRFLEWGSATGVITIMADMLGYDACGIEIDSALVEMARGLAERHHSGARFAAGSFLPQGYVWRPRRGDNRLGTIGDVAPSGYPMLGHPLDDFDLVYGYPWTGEEPVMIDLMRLYGRRGARLLVHGSVEGFQLYVDGRRLPDPTAAALA